MIRVVLFLLALGGCNTSRDPASKDDPLETGSTGELPEEYTLPDASALPAELTTATITSPDGGLPLVYQADKADAVTAWADCAAMISVCLHASAGDFDGCVAGVPTCATETPWEEPSACCPAACVSDYQALRAKKRAPFDSYARVFALDRTCMPGLEAR